MVSVSFLGLASGVSALLKTAVVVVGVLKGSDSLMDGGVLSSNETKAVLAAKEATSFVGDFATTMPVVFTSEGRAVLVVGLGDQSEKILDYMAMELGGAIFERLEELKAKKALIIAPAELEARVAYGAFLRSFLFNKYFHSKKSEHTSKVEEITVAVRGDLAGVNKEFAALKAEGESVFFTRSLISEPANILYPEEYAQRVYSELTPMGVEVEILGEQRLKAEGMMALLGVGQGSSKESRLVVMKWNGDPDNEDTLAFVGKGVTFDTGGISLKPPKGMWEMKYDMGGSAVVAGLIRTLAARKAKVNAVGVVGLVENAVDGNAQRPGDIVRSMSGQTIEVLNTDAEGRLVLADALWYTQKIFSPKFMVDLATLTGAIIVALGEGNYAGLFSNDDKLSEQLVESGKVVNEKLWRMPMGDEFDKMIDSPVADMKNIATDGHGADSITAAQFLRRFVNGVPWAHLDIAGVTWNDSGSKIAPRGATGFGVMLLNKFVQEYHEGVATNK
ncbi:leucyl aminopeptidase [Candidatus Anaplasma sp. TIGMIC]|uniref:leucyl aminopeptidase n=1 Tax=Candidatus Anaplasma sp. TIGMIC TaxID=3020713 RepID=UPI00232A8647|nr:leucyl aminopeptidase [Candidatus Anaplasma sp. TIGMIC]MDB1135180.1 leucyl aminopeptidase [Candidatus Anaplasma sp. TIGMIC]